MSRAAPLWTRLPKGWALVPVAAGPDEMGPVCPGRISGNGPKPGGSDRPAGRRIGEASREQFSAAPGAIYVAMERKQDQASVAPAEEPVPGRDGEDQAVVHRPVEPAPFSFSIGNAQRWPPLPYSPRFPETGAPSASSIGMGLTEDRLRLARLPQRPPPAFFRRLRLCIARQKSGRRPPYTSFQP